MKRNYLSKAYTLLIASVAAMFTLTSCDPLEKYSDGEDDIKTLKNFVNDMMKEYYYWADEMPSGNASATKVEDYFESKLVAKDHWSWMMDGDTFRELMTGVSTSSYGFHFVQPIDHFGDYGVYISYSDPASPVGKEGIGRGWRLTHINGVATADCIKNNTFYDEIGKMSNKFTFLSPENVSKEVTLTQSSFKAKTVNKTAIFTKSDFAALKSTDKVGYIHYTDFTASLKDEIMNALQEMKQQGVTDLILDLRYNGGGDLELCEDICSRIAPGSADGKKLCTLSHSSANRALDETYKIKRDSKSLNLNRLFVIMTKGTASASEVVINCLSPYMDVHTVGRTSYGKPNGMYLFAYPTINVNSSSEYHKVLYGFLPICFYTLNSNGKADYDNGITPENVRYDDVYKDFSAKEGMIAACLQYIATGSYPLENDLYTASSATKSSAGIPLRLPEEKRPGAYILK